MSPPPLLHLILWPFSWLLSWHFVVEANLFSGDGRLFSISLNGYP